MKPKCTVVTLLCIIFAASLVSAQRNFQIEAGQSTQSQPTQGERWALLVGIDTYDDPTISRLNYCVADVKGFYEALIDPSLGRFKRDNVYLMTGVGTGRNRPTNTNVIVRLEKLTELVKPEDTFVFYFSGHGMTRDGKP